MFSSKDFEKCWFLYQSEGLPYNLSIEEFCLKQGVPVNEFNKWYRDTHKRIHPIQVDGAPTSESKEETPRGQTPPNGSVQIAVTICMSNGVFIRRKNLSYESLLKFVASDHFVDDEHFCYFDDMYSPDYSLQWIYEDIMKYDIDEDSRKLLEEGHKEILQSECYEDYGYPSYIR